MNASVLTERSKIIQPLHKSQKNMSEDIRFRLKSGMIVKVHQVIKDVNKKGEEKERIQIFEGQIIATKHGNEPGATFTVRKVSNGIGVEKIFPVHSPVVANIELLRQMRLRRAKAYFLRTYKKKLREVKKAVKVDTKTSTETK